MVLLVGLGTTPGLLSGVTALYAGKKWLDELLCCCTNLLGSGAAETVSLDLVGTMSLPRSADCFPHGNFECLTVLLVGSERTNGLGEVSLNTEDEDENSLDGNIAFEKSLRLECCMKFSSSVAGSMGHVLTCMGRIGGVRPSLPSRLARPGEISAARC